MCVYHNRICLIFIHTYLELRASASSSTKSQFENVRSKLTSLGCVYGGSERFFPVKYLAMMLEEHACARGWEVEGVHRTLREIGVTMVTLFKIYDKMFKFKVNGVS